MFAGKARSLFPTNEGEQARRAAVKVHHGRLMVLVHGTMLPRAGVYVAASDQVGLTGGQWGVRLIVGQLDDSDGFAVLVVGRQGTRRTAEHLPAFPNQTHGLAMRMNGPVARLANLWSGGPKDPPAGITQAQPDDQHGGSAKPDSFMVHGSASTSIIQPGFSPRGASLSGNNVRRIA